MTELSALEDVVRVIFPATMMREGELLPAAFKLREHAGEAETYVSVFRQYADTFADDISTFDRARNLPCAIMGVGEIHSSAMKIGENVVNWVSVNILNSTCWPYEGDWLKSPKSG